MNGLYQVSFYSSNTDIKDVNNRTVQYPLKTDVEALADIEITDVLDLLGFYASLEIDSETKKYWNGAELIVNKVKDIWNIQLVPINFPTTEISVDSLYTKEFIKKKYKWIDIADYTIRPNDLMSEETKLVAVNLVSASFEDDGVGMKTISYTFKERT